MQVEDTAVFSISTNAEGEIHITSTFFFLSDKISSAGDITAQVAKSLIAFAIRMVENFAVFCGKNIIQVDTTFAKCNVEAI
jgi:hypothetical protein